VAKEERRIVEEVAGLEQRRLAAAVLADEEGDAGLELELGERRDSRDLERIAAARLLLLPYRADERLSPSGGQGAASRSRLMVVSTPG
jgi:hypothetical protein